MVLSRTMGSAKPDMDAMASISARNYFLAQTSTMWQNYDAKTRLTLAASKVQPNRAVLHSDSYTDRARKANSIIASSRTKQDKTLLNRHQEVT